MKKNIFIITLLVGCCSLSAWAQKQEKTITVEVNNNWDRAKTDEPVVINLRYQPPCSRKKNIPGNPVF